MESKQDKKLSKIPCAVSQKPSQSSLSDRSTSLITRSRTQFFPPSQSVTLNKSRVNFSMEKLYEWDDGSQAMFPKLKDSNQSAIGQKSGIVKPSTSKACAKEVANSMKSSAISPKLILAGRKNSKLDLPSKKPPCKIEKLQLTLSEDDFNVKEITETLGKIPGIWEKLVNDILAAQDASDEVIEKFDQTKKITCNTVVIVAKYMQNRIETITEKEALIDENQKLKNSQRALNNRVATLNSKLTSAEASLKSLKANFEKEKCKLEGDLSRTAAELSKVKRDYQRMLKEKTAALGRASEELDRMRAECVENDAMKISVSLAESDDGNSSKTTTDRQSGRKEVSCEECARRTDNTANSEATGNAGDRSGEVLEMIPKSVVAVTPETEVEALKTLVQRMDRTVAVLTSQNATLRTLVAKSKDDDKERRLVESLSTMLRVSKKDMHRLDNVVAMIKSRVLEAQQQRRDIEGRLTALEADA